MVLYNIVRQREEENYYHHYHEHNGGGNNNELFSKMRVHVIEGSVPPCLGLQGAALL
jgi:hypothetical protein